MKEMEQMGGITSLPGSNIPRPSPLGSTPIDKIAPKPPFPVESIVAFNPATGQLMTASAHKRIAPKVISAAELLPPSKRPAMPNDGMVDNREATLAAAAINLSLKSLPSSMPPGIGHLAIPMQFPHSMTPPTTVQQQPLDLVKIDSNGTLDLSMKSNKIESHHPPIPAAHISSLSTHTPPPQSPLMPTSSSVVQLSIPQPILPNPNPFSTSYTFPQISPLVQTSSSSTNSPTILQIPRSYDQAVDFSGSKKPYPLLSSFPLTSVGGVLSSVGSPFPSVMSSLPSSIPLTSGGGSLTSITPNAIVSHSGSIALSGIGKDEPT